MIISSELLGADNLAVCFQIVRIFHISEAIADPCYHNIRNDVNRYSFVIMRYFSLNGGKGLCYDDVQIFPVFAHRVSA